MLTKHEFVANTEKCGTRLYLCAENATRKPTTVVFFLYNDIKTGYDSFLCSPYLSYSVANNTALCITFIQGVS